MKIPVSDKENQKIIVMAVLIAFSCFLTVYFHLILGICTIFTHVFYIPVILASFWWKRKGIVVAVFLAGVLIAGHKLYSGDVDINEDYLRGFSFILVSTVVALLSEWIAREEKNVRESHAELDQIFQTATDGMRVVDRDFNVLRMNDTFLELAGMRREDAAGRKCYEVFPGPRCHTPGCALVQILGGEKYVVDEVEKTGADGKKIPGIVTATPFRHPDGELIGIVEDFRDITERKRAEEALNKSLHEKEMLLKEIHHRVKNNLQIVASLLNLQSRHITDPATLAMFRESQNRVRAMALVHERLYRSEDISSIDLSDYVRFMGTNLFKFYEITPATVRLEVGISDIRMDINRAIPLGLLINELLSNSLKHAFPAGRKGTIAVTGEKDDGTVRIIVQDDGAGIPESLDWKNTSSLGLQLVNSLTDQLEGTIELDRTAGTKFTIRIPVAQDVK
ncbi:MAG: histidine kinase dimerization/phosphoacceptor domain -containing protein [Methanoregula sp.]|nr:histidine kinase dimerization/phosphoacceptor domain -containing protein [Methanoregula sp.]